VQQTQICKKDEMAQIPGGRERTHQPGSTKGKGETMLQARKKLKKKGAGATFTKSQREKKNAARRTENLYQEVLKNVALSGNIQR